MLTHCGVIRMGPKHTAAVSGSQASTAFHPRPGLLHHDTSHFIQLGLSYNQEINTRRAVEMKARKLLADAVYDPAELATIGKAFDDAWDQVAPQVSKRAEAIEAARLKLAEIVIGLSRNGMRDPQWLAENAVKAMLARPQDLK